MRKLFLVKIFIILFHCIIYSQPLNGDYFIGGSMSNYQSLGEAISSLTNNGITGSVNFIIKTGIYEEQISIGPIQGVNFTNIVTFKSESSNNYDVVIKHSPITSPWHVVNLSGCSGIVFENITFTNGNSSGSSNKYGLVLKLESTNHITLKNCILNGKINPIDQSEFNDLIYSQTGSNHNLLITKCTFNDGKTSIALLGNGTYSQNIVISENQFNYSYGNTLHLLYTISTTITKNSIINSGYLLNKTGILVAYSYSPIKISLNTIYGDNQYELRLVSCAHLSGEIDVSNNFITNNFGTAGIVSDYCSEINLYHNTIYSFGSHAALIIYCAADNNCNIRNNIFKANGNGIYYILSPNKPKTSDNNLFYPDINAKIGYIYGVGYIDSLDDWRNISSLDSNSVNKPVFFKNIDDLHLDSISIGDLSLKGASLGVINDIDGESRNLMAPYMGADENIQFPLPVELVIFSSKVNLHGVVLYWKTVSELNNYGFDIECQEYTEWIKVGFVEGFGSTNSPKEYSFMHKPQSDGKIRYRLKQIDRDGAYTYSKELEINFVLSPTSYFIDQCYPNPFNPSTTIGFGIPKPSFVNLNIYNALGQEIATLVSDKLQKGSYQRKWDASAMPSGVYFYRIQAGEFVQTKKMFLLK